MESSKEHSEKPTGIREEGGPQERDTGRDPHHALNRRAQRHRAPEARRRELHAKRGLKRFLRQTKSGLLRVDRAAVNSEAHLDGKFLLRTSAQRRGHRARLQADCLISRAAGAT